jgi:hypothetical protein
MATPPVFVSGAILTAAQMNAVGLWLIKTQTIGSAVSSVSITDVFSSDYDNYLIKITGMTGSAAADTTMQLSGITTGVYTHAGTAQLLSGSTVFPYQAANATTMPIGTMATTQNTQIIIELSSPFLARTKYAISDTISANLTARQGTQILSTVSSTGFTIAPASGTLTGGTIKVYGYQNG